MQFPSAAPPFAHIQTASYDANAVVTVTGCPGLQTMVHVLPAERIEVVAVGNSFDWQIIPNQRGSLLSVKATGSAPSNLTVVTDRHSYLFALVPASPDDCVAGRIVHELRFRQPE